MSVRLIIDHEAASDAVAMYCSTSGFAFGPVFDTEDEATDFLDWFRSARRADASLELGADTRGSGDPRSYDDNALELLHGAWKTQYDAALAGEAVSATSGTAS